MKFLLDQSTDSRLLTYITKLGHDATQIRRTYPHSIPDPEVLSLAYQEKRILITDDRYRRVWPRFWPCMVLLVMTPPVCYGTHVVVKTY